MDHNQWPGPTSRADVEMRREPTGIYLPGQAGPFQGGRPALAGFGQPGLTPSRHNWALRPKIAWLPALHVMGPGHPYLAADPGKMARRAGDDAAALRDRWAALLPVISRQLGTDNTDTLVVRSNLATWTGAAGDAAAARDQFGTAAGQRRYQYGTLITRIFAAQGPLDRGGEEEPPGLRDGRGKRLRLAHAGGPAITGSDQRGPREPEISEAANVVTGPVASAGEPLSR